MYLAGVCLQLYGGPQNCDPLSLNSTDVQQLNENWMPYLQLAYFFHSVFKSYNRRAREMR